MPIVLDEHDNGRLLVLGVGDVLEIHLPENPSTGYRWSPDPPIPYGLVVTRDENDGFQRTVGAGSKRVIELQIKTHGFFEIRFRHWREWQGPASEIGVFQLRILAR